jgi:hypothetical protein
MPKGVTPTNGEAALYGTGSFIVTSYAGAYAYYLDSIEKANTEAEAKKAKIKEAAEKKKGTTMKKAEGKVVTKPKEQKEEAKVKKDEEVGQAKEVAEKELLQAEETETEEAEAEKPKKVNRFRAFSQEDANE